MALRSSFCEPSPNGFCKQELRSPAQTVTGKASCLEALCELPLTSSPRALEKRRHFLLHVFKVGCLEEQGGVCAILGTLSGPSSPHAYVPPFQGLLFAFPSARKPSLSTQVPYFPVSLHQCGSHLSVICHHPLTLSPGQCPLCHGHLVAALSFSQSCGPRTPGDLQSTSSRDMNCFSVLPNILPLHPERRGLSPDCPFELTV